MLQFANSYYALKKLRHSIEHSVLISKPTTLIKACSQKKATSYTLPEIDWHGEK